MSSKYDIKCKVIEEELRSVWPEWHVAGRLGGGAFGDVFQRKLQVKVISLTRSLVRFRSWRRSAEHRISLL